MKFIATILIACIVTLGSSQSALSDAIELRKHLKDQQGNLMFTVDESSYKVWSTILQNYTPLNSTLYSELADQFFDNPFIGPPGQNNPKVFMPVQIQGNPNILIDEASRLKEVNPEGGSIFSVTNLADGIAKFLVKRAKEELNATFFQKFADALTETNELKTLFPNTSSTLTIIGKEIYNFNVYLEILRDNFIRDSKSLPINLKKYLINNDVLHSTQKQLLVEDALEISQYIINGTPAPEIINYLSHTASIQDNERINRIADLSTKTKYQNLANSFILLDVISASLMNEKSTWMDSRDVFRALEDPATLDLYLGLLWQQQPKITVTGSLTFRHALDQVANTSRGLFELKSVLKNFSVATSAVQSSIVDFKSNNTDEKNSIEYYQYLDNFSNILNATIGLKKLFIRDYPGDTLLYQFNSVINHLNELHVNVRRNHYSSAIINVVFILEEILHDDFKFRTNFLKYGNFIASVAEAQSSDQVASAIELFALPPGSSRLKKHADFSIALNAYIGIGGGIEYLDELGSDKIFAISAPIGVNFNWGLGEKGSLSIYTPLIDVGAIASYRFDDVNTKDLPELTLQNILAPGAYLIYGFWNDLPLSLGAGAQLGPNLREVNENVQLQINEDSGWRWMIFLNVDIPLSHLYTN